MVPSELNIGSGIYISPFFLVLVLAFIAASLTAVSLNRLRWSRFFAHPPVAFLAMTTIYAVLIGTYVIPA